MQMIFAYFTESLFLKKTTFLGNHFPFEELFITRHSGFKTFSLPLNFNPCSHSSVNGKNTNSSSILTGISKII